MLSGRKELSEHTFTNLDLEIKTPFYAHIDGEIITDINTTVIPNVLVITL